MNIRADLKWLAGVIDVSGSLLVRHGQRGNFPRIRIVTTDKKLAYYLADSVCGTTQPVKGSKWITWRWNVSSHTEVQQLLLAVMPYLRFKRDEARVLLAACDLIIAPEDVYKGRPQANKELRDKLAAQLDEVKVSKRTKLSS